MKYISQFALLTVLFSISSQVAYSCSCFQISNADEVAITDFIFVGKVIGITEDKSYVSPKIEISSPFLQKMIDTRKRYLVKFKLEKNFKGLESDEITLVKYDQESYICAGISYLNDKTYLIYADKNKDNEEISDNGLCSRTQSFSKKSKDYKELLRIKDKHKK